ncbi:MAG: folylpolyglutamate synthase/dihydrofolate synthase family protein [Dehalococcoidia bacterium]
MDYRAAVDYLLTFADFERGSAARRSAEAFALDRIKSLLARLSLPQDGRTTVHVAGSKGKGSTAAMIESVLRAAGYRTGLFTSPHLHEFTERIRLDGRPLSGEAFAALVEKLQPVITDELSADPGRLSTFEILTAMGFVAFRDADVDVQVIEVGLGGRLDSTNVIREKAAAVVTALSWEHADVLGSSLQKIAWEKAGIITPGATTAVLAPQRSSEVVTTVREYATDVYVPLVDVADAYRWEAAGREPSAQWFRLTRLQPRPGEAQRTLYLTPLLGLHQIENAATAVATVEALRAQGLEIPNKAIHQGLATVDWPGRLETLAREPWIVVDGAHNEESLERVLESLPVYFDFERLIVVLGVLGDKNVESMARRIREQAAAVVLTQPDHPRAQPPQIAAAAFEGWDRPLTIEPRVADALKAAENLASPRDLICVLGSLFVAAEARAHMRDSVGSEPTSARADREP